MATLLTKRRFTLLILGYALLSLVCLTVAPLFGSESLAWDRVWNAFIHGADNVDGEIFLYHRLPRVILAFLVGGSLALAGGALQVVLRNPLAEPFVLGIAGGGAVGAVLAISIPGLFMRFGPFSTVQAVSLIGCMVCVAGIYRLARTWAGISMSTILLAGVTINILCGAAILLIRYLVSPHLLVAMDRWMMGGLDVVGYMEIVALMPVLLPGVCFLLIQGNDLNQLAFGEAMAAGHGVNVDVVHKQIFLGTGLVTAAAVSLAGPIGFVGLIIPHAVRRITGLDHRVVLPASFCLGGGFLTLCDLIARTIVSPTEMPVGIITAVIGGPVFLRILLKRSSN
jgi:iron complex transport system permease protein